MLKKILVYLMVGFVALSGSAQELICQVQIITPTIQASDKTIYETLRTSISDFMNNRKWTQDGYLNQERIECSLLIHIKNRVSVDEFDASIQVTTVRPIYKTSYKSPVLNINDQDFTFKYVQDQTIEFDEATINSNLTAVLAYYANLIIGYDYDTFSQNGGTQYYSKAQNIVNASQALPDKGWKSFEGTQNRYWIAESILNVSFKSLRTCLYRYHRLGFDRMADNMPDGRAAVLESLKEMKKAHQDRPGSYLMQTFFDAKVDEIVNLYSASQNDEKNQVVQLLNLIDPAHSNKYNEISGGQ